MHTEFWKGKIVHNSQDSFSIICYTSYMYLLNSEAYEFFHKNECGS
jgi:hypothetical protein